MPIEFKSVKDYYSYDEWVLASVVQLATAEFCHRFLDRGSDPCGRLFDQMTQAARSVTANIAEGHASRQTSRKQEMRLTDVARASLAELQGDYLFLCMARNVEPWSRKSGEYATLAAVGLDEPRYSGDLELEAWRHVRAQKAKFEPWTGHGSIVICLNAMLVLCDREMLLLDDLLRRQLDDFRLNGGFTENLKQERLVARMRQKEQQGAFVPPPPRYAPYAVGSVVAAWPRKRALYHFVHQLAAEAPVAYVL